MYNQSECANDSKALAELKADNTRLLERLDAADKLIDRWEGEDGEYLGADDCALDLRKALGSK